MFNSRAVIFFAEEQKMNKEHPFTLMRMDCKIKYGQSSCKGQSKTLTVLQWPDN